MSKAIKLRNSVYLSSESIIHKRGGGWHYLTNILDNIYPVGSIFITMNSTNPSEYFGGKWEKISGGYLYATGSTSLGKTTYNGWGAQSTALTIGQMPSHTHRIGFTTSWGATVWDSATQDGYVGPRDPGNALSYGASANQAFVPPRYGTLFNETIGGGQGHTHNIATIDVWMWKRVS